MGKAAGRDQGVAMERVVRILIALAEKGERGISARKLCEIANLDDSESGHSQLRRDLRQLRSGGGWDIESSGEEGSEGRYVLHARDNRLELLLSPGERAALQQASMAPDTDRPDPPPRLADLEHAVERHCLVRFDYKHRPRTVHPHTLHNGPSGWMLRGREVESGTVKEFVVARVGSGVDLDGPGTAEVPEVIPRHDFNPMSWQVDPPETVRIATSADFADEALQMLTGSSVIERGADEVIIEVPITHRAAFRSRMAELGVRAHFVGPSTNADEMMTVLRQVAEGSD